jgi:hypothetical protein
MNPEDIAMAASHPLHNSRNLPGHKSSATVESKKANFAPKEGVFTQPLAWLGSKRSLTK